MSLTGAVVLVVVLVAATAFGLYRRRVDGRLRATPVPRPVPDDAPEVAFDPTDTDAAPGTAVQAEAAPPAASGQPPGVDAGRRAQRRDHPEQLSPDDLGEPLGERATLVQFSTAFCQPCRATRRTLDEVAGMVEGVAHVEIDAEAHLDLVRRLNVLRTPTVLVLDGEGQVVRRATGAPRKADVVAALGEII